MCGRLVEAGQAAWKGPGVIVKLRLRAVSDAQYLGG